MTRSLLAHPIPLAAIALLLANDHVLKAAWPGVITGKLSDFAGLVFFPLLVIAAVELAIGRAWRSRNVVLAVCGASLSVFAAIKLSSDAGILYANALGHAQWIGYAGWAALVGDSIPPVVPVAHTVDPTDLLAAIPGTLVAMAYAQAGSSLASR